MRHLNNVRKFNKDQEHRKAMFSNMMTSFFTHERITTTLAKAKELRRLSERAITRAKENSLHNKRMIMRRIHNRDVIAKLFDEIAPKFKEVNGGYTRILKLGNRAGDGADLARIELIDPAESAAKKKSKGASKQPASKRGAAKGAPVKKAAKPSGKPKTSAKAAAKKEADKAQPAQAASPDTVTPAQATPPGAASTAQAAPSGDAASPGDQSGDLASQGGENPPAGKS
jgi:large subunit ribosomal protein L17